MNRAAYYRSRAEECLQDAGQAPEPLRKPLLALAQQWTRLAEYAEQRQTGGAEAGQAEPALGRQIRFALPEQGDGDLRRAPVGGAGDRSLEEG